jgi:hypothetical protein
VFGSVRAKFKLEGEEVVFVHQGALVNEGAASVAAANIEQDDTLYMLTKEYWGNKLRDEARR